MQAALAQVLLDLGGVVYIPRRSVSSGNPFWTWSTLAQVFGARSKRVVLQGDEGGTYVLVAGTTPFSIGVFGEVHVDRLVFIGGTGGIDAPAVVEIGETRKGEVSNCDFLGLRTNATLTGCIHSLNDTFDIHHNFFLGCDYVGATGQGGVVTVYGHTQGGSLRNLRFSSVDGYQGLPFTMKSGSAGNVYLYVGGQDDPALSQALAPTVIEQCYFEPGAPRGAIEISGTRGGNSPSMRCGEVIIQASGFDVGGTVVRADKLDALTMRECAIGNNATGTVAIMAGNCKRASFRNVRISGPGTFGSQSLYKVKWTGPVIAAEFWNHPNQLNDDGSVNPYIGLVVDETDYTPGSTRIHTGGIFTNGTRPSANNARYWEIRNASSSMREEYSNGANWFDSTGAQIA